MDAMTDGVSWVLTFVIWAFLHATVIVIALIEVGGPGWLLLALLFAAAVIDARSRRFPNLLAAACVAAAALTAAYPAFLRAVNPFSWGVGLAASGSGPLGAVLANAVIAALATVALLAFELAWRRFRGASGLGMGDVKLLFALMLADPISGAISFVAGLALLGIGCVVARRASLPLIPFVVPVWAVLFLARAFGQIQAIGLSGL